MIKCEHWRDCGVSGGGCCNIHEFKKPSIGVCLLICKKNTHKPSRGAGDTVKKIIAKVTRGKIEPCGGCKKRQELLNKLLPYSSGGNDDN